MEMFCNGDGRRKEFVVVAVVVVVVAVVVVVVVVVCSIVCDVKYMWKRVGM